MGLLPSPETPTAQRRARPVSVAIVTGASRGIGAAAATGLAGAGFDIVVSYSTDQHGAGEVAQQVTKLGQRALIHAADIGDPAAIAGLFRAAETLGPLGALINNAAFAPPASELIDMDAQRIARTFQVNAVGALLCAREAILAMSSSHGGLGGSIVNVSSGAAVLGSPGEFVDYAASKAAVETMTIGLAREVGKDGVRVNAVRPGIIDTTFHASTGQPDKATRLADGVPLGRAGSAEEAANAIVWLCSPAASYVNGAVLAVTGGR